MNNVLRDLGLEYAMNTDDYDVLRAQIYEYYGMVTVLGGDRNYDFPEPLWALEDAAPLCHSAYLCHSGLDPESLNKEQFFKHMLHPDARALLPFINVTLAKEHKNSPIFAASAGLALDRESLAQIVDRVHHLARASGVESSSHRALLNVLTLMELLVWQT